MYCPHWGIVMHYLTGSGPRLSSRSLNTLVLNYSIQQAISIDADHQGHEWRRMFVEVLERKKQGSARTDGL